LWRRKPFFTGQQLATSFGVVGDATALLTLCCLLFCVLICLFFVLLRRWCVCSCDVLFCSRLCSLLCSCLCPFFVLLLRWCECSCDVLLYSLLCCSLGGASAFVTFICVLFCVAH
jgi:hypothetical protein